MSTYRLMDGSAGRPGNGPSSPEASYDGDFGPAVMFTVTAGATYFQGYWWWVCPDPNAMGNTQPTDPQEFCLWCLHAPGEGVIVSGSTVTSVTLSSGWNWVPLPNPVPLAPHASYVAQTGFSGPFPDTPGQFGNGEPYSAGISNGPLFAYSDEGGSAPGPAGLNMSQGLFDENASPTAGLAAMNPGTSDNFWIDVQVTDVIPEGASYRLWPNYPQVFTDGGGGNTDNFGQTFGVEFTLSQPCILNGIWFYSPSGVASDAAGPIPSSGTQSATGLPTMCGIFNVATQAVLPGTLNRSPAWSGAAGSGWVACQYSGVMLPAGDYKACVYTTGGWDNFYLETHNYWGAESSSVPASAVSAPAGITAGPLAGLSAAQSAEGQITFHHDADGPVGFAYPTTSQFTGQNRWVDVEVTPAPPSVTSGIALAFFP
jgi:hypothetical protein